MPKSHSSKTRSWKGEREDRQDRAKLRQKQYAKLTLEQRLEALDNRLGSGQGAKKQRARISAQIVERDAPKPEKPKKSKPPRRKHRKPAKATE